MNLNRFLLPNFSLYTNDMFHHISHCGGTGRRDGFKIHLRQLSVGSSPTSGTIKILFYILTL